MTSGNKTADAKGLTVGEHEVDHDGQWRDEDEKRRIIRTREEREGTGGLRRPSQP